MSFVLADISWGSMIACNMYRTCKMQHELWIDTTFLHFSYFPVSLSAGFFFLFFLLFLIPSPLFRCSNG